ncbi:hypothetical protein [Salinicola peritrichatus]|nr:hypothetical protein [Salinicola peritrichatus]
MHSTEALRARKSALYVEMERILGEAMDELWPAPQRSRGVIRPTAQA